MSHKQFGKVIDIHMLKDCHFERQDLYYSCTHSSMINDLGIIQGPTDKRSFDLIKIIESEQIDALISVLIMNLVSHK